MKKLGFGLMRLPMREGAQAGTVDLEQVMQMADLFLERGFTYFDTAWMYCGFSSENAVKTVLHWRQSCTPVSSSLWRIGTGFLRSSSQKQARAILIIICCMGWRLRCCRNMRPSIVFTGFLRRKPVAR